MRLPKFRDKRLERLFSNLVDLARIRAGAISLRLEPVEIADAIASALEALKRQTANHEIIYDIPASVPLVRSDERLLHHILVNLIDNACKFSPPGGPIEIVLQINSKVRAKVVVPNNADAATLEKIALADPTVQKFLEGKTPKKVVAVPNKLVNFIV